MGAVLEYVQRSEVETANRESEEHRRRAEKEARTAARLRWLTVSLAVLFAFVLAVIWMAWSYRQTIISKQREALAKQLENAAACSA